MHFKELKVWQKSTCFAVDLYSITKEGLLAKDYGLRDQMRRASVSIASNIAEGYSRESDKDRCHFLVIAKGSCAELQTQLEISKEAGLLDAGVAQALDERCEEIARMLSGLIKVLRVPSL
jgi:four helix bundle protein